MSNIVLKRLQKLTSILVLVTLVISSIGVSQVQAASYDGEAYSDVSAVTLKAVGDNLIHSSLIKADFDEFYSGIKDYISDADLRMINQETMFIKDKSKYSGYPCFGTPTGVGKAMKKAGFNIIICATNHSLDKGFIGIKDTVAFWNKYKDEGIVMTGIYDNEDDAKEITTIEANGLTFAVLNYTYGTNGIKIPAGKEFCVNMLDTDKIKSDIKRAKMIADFVIVCPHWGIEYTHIPTKDQTALAKKMADWGADVIIGNHPHVVEPLEIIVNKKGKEVPCFYSLGNFISAQNKQSTMLGAIAEVTFSKNRVTGEKKVESKMTPIVTWFNKSYTKFKTYLLKDYTEDLSKTHGLKNTTKKGLKKIWAEIQNEDAQ